jgi:hypothetical protein
MLPRAHTTLYLRSVRRCRLPRDQLCRSHMRFLTTARHTTMCPIPSPPRYRLFSSTHISPSLRCLSKTCSRCVGGGGGNGALVGTTARCWWCDRRTCPARCCTYIRRRCGVMTSRLRAWTSGRAGQRCVQETWRRTSRRSPSRRWATTPCRSAGPTASTRFVHLARAPLPPHRHRHREGPKTTVLVNQRT